MKTLNDIEEYLDINTKFAMDEFHREINTDENKDYRRGFRAGVLFSHLHIKANIAHLNSSLAEESN
jgi:hypothetical protein